MKQIKFNFGEQSYETPSVNVLNVQSEGVLCGSYDRADFGYEDNDLGEI